MTLQMIEGPYLDDILDQPGALDRTARLLRGHPALEALARTRPRRLVLTGMGSSYHAMHPLLLALSAAGYDTHRVETSELIHSQTRLLDGETLTIALSQSGRSAETVTLLDLVDNDRLVGITNDADSPLARGAGIVVPLAAGPESTVSCKSYVASLLALDILADALLGRRTDGGWDEAGALVGTYLSDWRAHCAGIADQFGNMSQLYLAGRGSSLAAAGTGGLILKETTRRAAEGMSAAAFRHGPIEVVREGVKVCIFTGPRATAALNHQLVDDVRAAGGWAELIGPGSRFPPFAIPAAPERLMSALEILPVQMMTLAIAALQGDEAGRFTLATKVTAVA